MAEFGELCLWAALPLGTLAAAAAIAGGLTRRNEWAVLGGRAMDALAALTFLAVAGLAYALITVRLKYSYVAALAGFQDPWPWRLAALWSGPAGGALCLTLLISLTGVLSYRLGRSGQASARTGSLAVLALIGLFTVMARAQPFDRADAPAIVGAGLPLAIQSLAWQVEMGSAYLAIACGSFVFAGIVGAQLSESSEGGRGERFAMRLAAAALTVAMLASTWRAYAGSGRLLDVTGLFYVGVHAPAWLLSFAYLHAPAGRFVPNWAIRWRRILGVAFFPTVLGDGAAMLVGLGAVPPATFWVGGLAVGVVSGAMSGMSRHRAGTESLRSVPGYGPWAFQGGLFSLALAGVLALWGVLRAPAWSQIGWPVALLGLAASAAWALVRPAGGWRHVWPVGLVAALAVGALAHATSGWAVPEFAVASGLAAAAFVGLIADAARLRAARSGYAAQSLGGPEAVAGARAWRRWGSALGHLAIALIVIGAAAEPLTQADTQPLMPGDTLAVPGGATGGARVTYLGLSRYQVGESEKRVASFALYKGEAAPRLVTAAMSFDLAQRREYRTPAISRGALGDVIVELSGLSGSREGIVCRVARRPLASLVWLGGLMLFAAVIVRGMVDR